LPHVVDSLRINQLQLLNALFGLLFLSLVHLCPVFLLPLPLHLYQLLLFLTTLLGLLHEALTIHFLLDQILLDLLVFLCARYQLVFEVLLLLNVFDQLLREAFVALPHLFYLFLVHVRQ